MFDILLPVLITDVAHVVCCTVCAKNEAAYWSVNASDIVGGIV
jgi:hypothetical protein